MTKSYRIKKKAANDSSHERSPVIVEAADFKEAEYFEQVDDAQLSRYCSVCAEPGEMIVCEGGCHRQFHFKCAGLHGALAKDMLDRMMKNGQIWQCSDCRTGMHECFTCKKQGVIGAEVFRCEACGNAYHPHCAPGAGEEGFLCPAHRCSLCGKEDNPIREPRRRRLLRCWCCPTAFCNKSSCMPGGAKCVRINADCVICDVSRPWHDVTKVFQKRVRRRREEMEQMEESARRGALMEHVAYPESGDFSAGPFYIAGLSVTCRPDPPEPVNDGFAPGVLSRIPSKGQRAMPPPPVALTPDSVPWGRSTVPSEFRYANPQLTSRIAQSGLHKRVVVETGNFAPFVGRYAPLLLTRMGPDGGMNLLPGTHWPMLSTKIAFQPSSVLQVASGEPSIVKTLIENGTAIHPLHQIYTRHPKSAHQSVRGSELNSLFEQIQQVGITPQTQQRRQILTSNIRAGLNGLAINRAKYTYVVCARRRSDHTHCVCEAVPSPRAYPLWPFRIRPAELRRAAFLATASLLPPPCHRLPATAFLPHRPSPSSASIACLPLLAGPSRGITRRTASSRRLLTCCKPTSSPATPSSTLRAARTRSRRCSTTPPPCSRSNRSPSTCSLLARGPRTS